jgi:ribosomal protein S11
MGTKGVKQKRRETPAALQDFATQLEDIAKSLRYTAERMLLAGVKTADVRYSPGAYAALRDSLRPFAFDADKKASKAIEAKKHASNKA